MTVSAHDTHEGLSARDAHEKKKAPHVPGVLPVFHERWSPRSFQDREVSRETLAKVFEAARWAASSNNEQPWRFLVGSRGSETYNKIFESLVEFNQNWARTAPVLILGIARAAFSHNNTPNRHALYDLGAAASYMTLQAAALGVATHQMAGFDPDKARTLLGIPDDYLIGAVIALGYQDAPAKLASAALIEREVAPRARKPIHEIVFDAWDHAMALE
jgi:nitroreductase